MEIAREDALVPPRPHPSRFVGKGRVAQRVFLPQEELDKLQGYGSVSPEAQITCAEILAALDESERKIITMYFSGFSPDEISHMTDLNSCEVRRLVMISVRKMRLAASRQ
jgi:DNA-directed RNA polymerase specialized sigma24 family protein